LLSGQWEKSTSVTLGFK